MARVQYGSIVTSLRGSIGGTVFQNNKYGYTAKNTPCKVISNTSLSLARRLLMVEATRYWAGMDDSNRGYFDSFAVTYPQYAKHNIMSVLSGYAIFLRWYVAFRLAGYTFPSGFISTPYASYSYSPAVARSGAAFNFDLVANQTYTNYIFALYASLPVPSHRMVKPSSFRLVGSVSLDNQTLNLAPGYLAAFSFLPVTGDTVWFRIVAFHREMPWVVAPALFKVIVT